MEKVRFLWHSLKNFRQMGTVIRSSEAMCKKMTHFIIPEDHLNIVELGAGDGVITQFIMEKMSYQARLLVFEINPELCDLINKIKDDRVIVINDSAEHLEYYLNLHNITEADIVISAIPFLVLPDDLTRLIINSCKRVLKTDGIFIQMHYIRSIKKLYKSIFGNVQTFFVPVNIPPGYVFKCVKEN
ncbi:MAG: methyltransferase domain-containing protein [Saprospiraceae bacterium]|nr:methyltransferase domain-containing protein [Saprospiraceae bacterium]